MMDKVQISSGGDVLVLNNDGLPLSVLPISTMNWRDAVKAMYLDQIDVLHTYEDWTVRSPSIEISVPAVVMTRQWVRMGRAVKYSRENVYLRDNYTCQYCHDQFPHDDLTLDHVIPRHNGGKSVWTNMVASCGPCNHKKSHFSLMKPAAAPRKPTYGEMIKVLKTKELTIRHPSWNYFLGWPEDKVSLIPPVHRK